VQEVANNARQANDQTNVVNNAQLVLFEGHSQGQLANVLKNPGYREGETGGLAQHQELAKLHEEGQQSAC